MLKKQRNLIVYILVLKKSSLSFPYKYPTFQIICFSLTYKTILFNRWRFFLN